MEQQKRPTKRTAKRTANFRLADNVFSDLAFIASRTGITDTAAVSAAIVAMAAWLRIADSGQGLPVEAERKDKAN